MKKILGLFLAFVLLVGCSKNITTVTDGDKTLASDKKFTVDKQGYYEALVDQYGASQLMVDVLSKIADEEIKDEEAVNKRLEERKKELSELSDKGLSEIATMYGYETEEEFINDRLIPDIKQEMLINQYIQENLDTYIKEQELVSMKVITVEKESDALQLIKDIKSEEDFDKKLKENEETSDDYGIVTKSSQLDENITKILSDLQSLEKDGVYEKAIKMTSETYAVIYVYDTQHEKIDDISSALSNIEDVQNEVTGIYLKKYKFEVYDSQLKSDIKDMSDEYID